MLKLDSLAALEAKMLDRFADVAKTLESAAFNKTCLEVNAAELLATTVAVELAAAVYPSIVDVRVSDEVPPVKDEVRFTFAKDSMACTLEFIRISFDKLLVAIERLLEAELYASTARRFERFAAM